LREVKLLKKLSKIDNNIFTTLLLEIIAPDKNNELNHIFLVMSLGATDMKSFLESKDSQSLTEEHILTLLYNMICAVHFVHSMGVIHRDLKPANFLMDANCGVTLCDFGISRAMPPKTQKEKEFHNFRRK
jgi:mitogen-activated protein kinase 1/3